MDNISFESAVSSTTDPVEGENIHSSNISNVVDNSLIVLDEEQENSDHVTDDAVAASQCNEASTSKPERAFYQPKVKFDNRKELQKYIDEINCFRHKSDNDTAEANVAYYMCSLVPKRQANKCPAKMKIVENKKSRDFCVFITTLVHNHEEVESKQNPISQEMRNKIYELNKEFHMKAAMIHKYLLSKDPDKIPPTIKQIRNILPKEKEKNIPRTRTYGELIEWCRANEKQPEEEDDGFILGHTYNKFQTGQKH